MPPVPHAQQPSSRDPGQEVPDTKGTRSQEDPGLGRPGARPYHTEMADPESQVFKARGHWEGGTKELVASRPWHLSSRPGSREPQGTARPQPLPLERPLA